jgi:hypothetical protein
LGVFGDSDISRVTAVALCGLQKASVFVADDEDGGLLPGLSRVVIAHDAARKLARLADSRVPHINSGLYRWGQGEVI